MEQSLMWLTAGALIMSTAIGRAASVGETPVRTVGSVDLDRYLGRWYEVARYPNRFQRDCVSDVTATYARRDDGRIDVVNRCVEKDGGVSEARGIARVLDDPTGAKLKVRFAPAWLSFLPAVWGDYWIIGLDEGYEWAVVGTPDRKYLWILSRAPELDEPVYAEALDRARENGFDTSRLTPTAQGRGQSGVRPGSDHGGVMPSQHSTLQ
jgi:apolipoprotein D and lipocalin family protein